MGSEWQFFAESCSRRCFVKSLHKDEFPVLPSRFLENSPAPARNVARDVPALAPALRLPRPADTTLRMALRFVAAFFFVTLGSMKFFDTIPLGTDAVSLPQGPVGFALYLQAVGV